MADEQTLLGCGRRPLFVNHEGTKNTKKIKSPKMPYKKFWEVQGKKKEVKKLRR